MNMSQSFCCFYFCLLASIALCAGEDISYKEKLISLIKEKYDGVAAFDDTISESMAKEEYLKYTNGEYSQNGIKEEKRSLISSGALFDAADKELILEVHNNYRTALCSEDGTVDDISGNIYPACSNMNYLFWDDALEQVAQGWADSLASSCGGLSHNSARSSDLQTYSNDASFIVPSNAYVGENVAYSGKSQSVNDISFATDGLESMWLEHKDWSYQDYQSGTINGAGHFTQMAWANTRYIACAAASCQSSYYKYFTVCNYYPGGNYLGEYPYSCAGSDCTNCDSDRTRWHDSQCGGCMNTAYTSGGSGGSIDCNDGFNNVANDGVDISTTTTCDNLDTNGCDSTGTSTGTGTNTGTGTGTGTDTNTDTSTGTSTNNGCEETSTTFCCDDGCEISKYWYQDGTWCDCSGCEDEDTCNCPSGGCNFGCGGWTQGSCASSRNSGGSDSSRSSSSGSSSSSNNNSNNNDLYTGIGIGIGVMLVLILIAITIIIIKKRNEMCRKQNVVDMDYKEYKPPSVEMNVNANGESN